MVYLGRVILSGITPDGNSFAAYAISGRSPGSQKRRFELLPDGHVYVGNIGELTPWQEEFKDLIFYNCMRTRGDLLFVTNGAQTDARIEEKEKEDSAKKIGSWLKKEKFFCPTFYHDFQNVKSQLDSELILMKWGYEPDAPIYTPRIAFVRKPRGDSIFSIAARMDENEDRLYTAQRLIDDKRSAGIATYKGIGDEAASWRGSDIVALAPWVFGHSVSGNTPDEIRDSMYDFMDPRFVVASVGAVWDGARWAISEPKNRWNSPKEFEAYLAEREAEKR